MTISSFINRVSNTLKAKKRRQNFIARMEQKLDITDGKKYSRTVRTLPTEDNEFEYLEITTFGRRTAA